MKNCVLVPILLSVSLGITQFSIQRIQPFLGGLEDRLNDMTYDAVFTQSLYYLAELLDDTYDYMVNFLFGDSTDQILDQLNLCYSDKTTSFLQTKQNVVDTIINTLGEWDVNFTDRNCLGGDFGRRAIGIILQELYEDMLNCDEFGDYYTVVVETSLDEYELGVNIDDEGLNSELDKSISDLRDNLEDVLSQLCKSFIQMND